MDLIISEPNINTTIGAAAQMGYFLMNNDTLWRFAVICVLMGVIIGAICLMAFSLTLEYLQRRRGRK